MSFRRTPSNSTEQLATIYARAANYVDVRTRAMYFWLKNPEAFYFEGGWKAVDSNEAIDICRKDLVHKLDVAAESFHRSVLAPFDREGAMIMLSITMAKKAVDESTLNELRDAFELPKLEANWQVRKFRGSRRARNVRINEPQPWLVH